MKKKILELLMNYHTTLDNGNNVIEMNEFDNLTDKLNDLFALHVVSQQRELLIALVRDLAEWDNDYSSTNLKLRARKILSNL